MWPFKKKEKKVNEIRSFVRDLADALCNAENRSNDSRYSFFWSLRAACTGHLYLSRECEYWSFSISEDGNIFEISLYLEEFEFLKEKADAVSISFIGELLKKTQKICKELKERKDGS